MPRKIMILKKLEKNYLKQKKQFKLKKGKVKVQASLLLSGALFLSLSVWLLASLTLTYRARMESLIQFLNYYQIQTLALIPKETNKIRINQVTIKRSNVSQQKDCYQIINSQGKIIAEKIQESPEDFNTKE